MNELIVNKKSLQLLYAYLCLSALFFPTMIVFACFSFKFHWLALLISIVCDGLILYLCIKKALKSYKESLSLFYYNDEIFKYVERGKEHLFIYLNNIEDIYYEYSEFNCPELIIKLYSGEIRTLPIAKINIKRMSKIIKRQIEFRGQKRIVKWWYETKKDIKNFFVTQKKRIISTFLGLIITITSLVLYFNNKENNMLTWVLVVIAIFFTFLELYFLYFGEKEYGKTGNLLMSAISTFACVLVIFVIVMIFLLIALKLDLTIDLLIVAIFLSPSFILVIMIVLLIIASLSYV